LRIGKQTALENFNAVSQELEDAQRQGASSSVVNIVVGALVFLALLIVVVVILQRKKSQPDNSMTSAANVDEMQDISDAIEGDFTQTKDEAKE
jgi:NADH:ubiquinone oxidoreductase subunit 6 (subunit J)